MLRTPVSFAEGSANTGGATPADHAFTPALEALLAALRSAAAIGG